MDYSLSLHSNQSQAWVLVTGATGLLGSAVLKELLGRGQRVLCIVRASTPWQARCRLAHGLSVWGAAADSNYESGQLAAIRGDISQPRLGLSESTVRRLGGRVKSVVHAAGSTALTK